MIQAAIWKEGKEWWGCYYNGYRIESMRGGFKTQGSAKKWAWKGANLC